MQGSNGQRKTFPLRLSRSVRGEAELLADREGISINQFIVLAVAEKVTRLERDFSSREISPSGDVNHTAPAGSAI